MFKSLILLTRPPPGFGISGAVCPKPPSFEVPSQQRLRLHQQEIERLLSKNVFKLFIILHGVNRPIRVHGIPPQLNVCPRPVSGGGLGFWYIIQTLSPISYCLSNHSPTLCHPTFDKNKPSVSKHSAWEPLQEPHVRTFYAVMLSPCTMCNPSPTHYWRIFTSGVCQPGTYVPHGVSGGEINGAVKIWYLALLVLFGLK